MNIYAVQRVYVGAWLGGWQEFICPHTPRFARRGGGVSEPGKTLFCLEYKTHPCGRLKSDFEKCEFGFREMQRWISVAAGGSGVWEAVMAAL